VYFLAFADSQIHVSVIVSKAASTGGIGLEFGWICSRIFHGGHWSSLSMLNLFCITYIVKETTPFFYSKVKSSRYWPV